MRNNSFGRSCNKQSDLILVAGILLLFILPLCSALSVNIPDSTKTEIYKANDNVELKFICILNNSMPSAAAKYNITISYPNGTTFINNIATTPLGNGAFSYIINFSHIGLYKAQMFCYDETYSYSEEGFYEITKDGTTPTISQGIIFLGIILSIISLTFFFGYLSSKFIDFEKMFPIGIFFLLISILLSIYSIYLGVVYSRDYLSFNVSGPQTAIFIGVLLGMIAVMLISLLFFVIYALSELKERKSIQQYGNNYNTKTKTYE